MEAGSTVKHELDREPISRKRSPPHQWCRF